MGVIKWRNNVFINWMYEQYYRKHGSSLLELHPVSHRQSSYSDRRVISLVMFYCNNNICCRIFVWVRWRKEILKPNWNKWYVNGRVWFCNLLSLSLVESCCLRELKHKRSMVSLKKVWWSWTLWQPTGTGMFNVNKHIAISLTTVGMLKYLKLTFEISYIHLLQNWIDVGSAVLLKESKEYLIKVHINLINIIVEVLKMTTWS